MKTNLKLFFYIMSVIFFNACYKPSANVASDFLGENIYVKMSIDKKEPLSSVYINDLFLGYIMGKLHKNITSYDKADTKIFVELTNLSFEPLYYNKDGYALEYKVVLNIKFSVYRFEKLDEFNTQSEYTFYLPPNSVIGDNLKDEAIKKASKDNFDEFISLIALKGF